MITSVVDLMRRFIATLVLLSAPSAIAQEPSSTAKVERARTAELRRQRQAKLAVKAVNQRAIRAQAAARLNAQVASTAQAQSLAANTAYRNFVGGTPMPMPAPVVFGPDAVIVTRSNNGQTWTSIVYPGGQIYPPPGGVPR